MTTFFFWASLYLYVPILSVYSQSIGASLSMIGAIVGAYAIPQLLFRIPIGIWFDTITRKKPLIALGILMTIVGALGLGLAPTPWFVFGARMLTGVGAAAWVLFTVYFSAYFGAGTGIKRAISIISFVQGSALVAATYSGGVIAEVSGYSYTFFGAAILGAAGLVFLLLSREPQIARGRQMSWAGFKSVISHKPLIIVSLMGLLTQFVNYTGIFGFVPIYAADIGASSVDLGIITTLCLAASAVAALAVVPIAKRLGNSPAILLSALILGGTIMIVPLINDVSLLKLDMLCHGLGRGFLTTIFLSLSIEGLPQQQRATAMGFYQATYALGMLTGPVISGFLANSVGLASAFYLSTLCCLVTAGMAFLPWLKRSEAG